MTTIADIQQLLTELENRANDDATEKALISSFNQRLADIAMSLADAVRIMEAPKPMEAEHHPPDFTPIVAALDRVCAEMCKEETPEAPADFGPIVGAINAAAAARPMHAGWAFDFDYSQVNGKLTGMRARPITA